ncbi:MAG: AAA family ATPase [Fusobacteriaceae bacterium]
MNLKLDNLYCFDNFEINFSYPKKIVNTTVPYEYLEERSNFRFKRVNIIMGANASGKTVMGKALMDILDFIHQKNPENLISKVADNGKTGFFEIDLVLQDFNLYRISCEMKSGKIMNLEIQKVAIGKRDSYESAKQKLETVSRYTMGTNGIQKLNEIITVLEEIDEKLIGWLFSFPGDELSKEADLDPKVLDRVLRTFDPSIKEVIKSEEVDNTFHIVFKSGYKLSIQEGKVIRENILSSGTREGIAIANAITNMMKEKSRPFYIDEKFSHVQSDLEISFLSLMIEVMRPKSQLFFTTHNMDILEMDLPIHSFTFLRKTKSVEVIEPSKIFKKNDRSLANAVKNDIFNTIPNTDLLDDLIEVPHEIQEL